MYGLWISEFVLVLYHTDIYELLKEPYFIIQCHDSAIAA